ncbi:MAG: DUF3159 domain-containing protein [Salinibacterium sp.]|nr:MAG: DUF3159 domain-containing protein [Salinibacterium sp.]
MSEDEKVSSGTPEPDEANPEAVPSFRDAFATAARESAFGKLKPGQTPDAKALLGAVGGVRGIIESFLPGIAFLVVYSIWGQLAPAVLVPLAIAFLFVIARAATRTPVTTALIGVIGLAISAGIALLTGRTENNFVVGLWLNAGGLATFLLSIALRRPIVGSIIALISADHDWRKDKAKLRVGTITTLLWSGLFGLRLVIEIPLYYAGQSQALGAFKLLLGLPMYAMLLWATWLLARSVNTPAESD